MNLNISNKLNLKNVKQKTRNINDNEKKVSEVANSQWRKRNANRIFKIKFVQS